MKQALGCWAQVLRVGNFKILVYVLRIKICSHKVQNARVLALSPPPLVLQTDVELDALEGIVLRGAAGASSDASESDKSDKVAGCSSSKPTSSSSKSSSSSSSSSKS